MTVVDTVWKGPEKAVIRVLSDTPATSQCGVYVTPGTAYAIYAIHDGETLPWVPAPRSTG